MGDTPVKLSAQPSLYKRGVRFYAKIKHPDGQWKNYNTGETLRQRALIVAEEFQARVDRGLPAIDKTTAGPTAPAALMTVRDLGERFSKECQPDVKDLEAYRCKARYELAYMVCPFIGDLVAVRVQRRDIREYLERLKAEKNYAPGTMRCALARVSTIYRWAIDTELLAMGNPCAGIKVPGKRRGADVCLSLEAIQRLLTLADKVLAAAERAPSEVSSELLEKATEAIMLVTALYSGMRRGELRALRWAWVDLDRLLLEVRASYTGLPKNGEERIIPLHAELRPWLLRWKAVCPKTNEGLLFPIALHSTNGRICGWHMEDKTGMDHEVLGELLQQADAPCAARPWHALRHTLASHLAKATRGNVDAVSKILGHRGPGLAVTLNYIHSADLDYLAGELNRLTYLPKAEATPAAPLAETVAETAGAGVVVDLQTERVKRRGTGLLPRALKSPQSA